MMARSLAALSFAFVALGTGCRGPDDLEMIARAVAVAAADVPDPPVAVKDEYICRLRVEPCRERAGSILASLVDAAPFVDAFAEAAGLPIVQHGGLTPTCDRGVWVEFLEPEIEGDRARVEAWGHCGQDGVAHGWTYEFRLEHEDGEWAVSSMRKLGAA